MQQWNWSCYLWTSPNRKRFLIVLTLCICRGFPRWLSRWRNCLQCRRHKFDPQVGKIRQRRKWQPTPVFLPGEFHGQRSLAGYSPWGHKELEMTKQLIHTHTHKAGGGFSGSHYIGKLWSQSIVSKLLIGNHPWPGWVQNDEVATYHSQNDIPLTRLNVSFSLLPRHQPVIIHLRVGERHGGDSDLTYP